MVDLNVGVRVGGGKSWTTKGPAWKLGDLRGDCVAHSKRHVQGCWEEPCLDQAVILNGLVASLAH